MLLYAFLFWSGIKTGIQKLIQYIVFRVPSQFKSMCTYFSASPGFRAQARGKLGRNSLPKLTNFSVFATEGEVLMYRLQ